MRDWLKESETEAALGLSTFIGFAIRLDKGTAKPANGIVADLIENADDAAVMRLASDEEKLLQCLDKEGINLVIHEVAKVLIPGIPETEQFLKLPDFDLSLQDSELNSSLHYLANAGVDLLAEVPFRLLMLKNRNGATPLHLLAKHEKFHDRLMALPESVLHLRTRNGATLAGIINSSKKPDPTALQELGRQ